MYDKDYFENGVETGLSCYQGYKWMQKETLQMCNSIIEISSIRKNESILDFGCAKGFLVKAFTILGYNCYGVDISSYAISVCDPEVRDKVSLLGPEGITEHFDVVISKDVLEHVEYERLEETVKNIRQNCQRLFVIVPLAKDGKYIAQEYELDVTHVIREDAFWWKETFERCGFKNVEMFYRINGIKDNWSHYNEANGFFLCS